MALNPYVATLLEKRGIANELLDAFISPLYDRDIHDPFLFDDMARAVGRLTLALTRGERITVYGDYDVDGVSGAVILHDILTKAGGTVSLFFNHREDDGYGLHTRCIDRIAQLGATLMITTDSGIMNAHEIAYARERGIDTIITDHHTPPQTDDGLPPAIAIIHPRVRADRYPWKHLSGGGCAFKLAQALCRTLSERDPSFRYEEKWLLDLVALSILSDRVPLQGENRALFYYGMKVMRKSRRAGLRALLSRTPAFYQSSPIDTLQFHVIPLLNAASRMEHASHAAALLCAHDTVAAEHLADKLTALNKERQRLTQRTLRSIPGSILLDGSLFLAASTHWRVGLLGLVAGKLIATYRKPVILLRTGGPQIVGVARSTHAVHIAQTFHLLSDFFERFGGHAAAGGFALKASVTLDNFVDAVGRLTPVPCADMMDAPSADTHGIEVPLWALTADFVSDLSRCEPWGAGNPQPTLVLRGCTITGVSPLGRRKQWSLLRIQQNGAVASVRIASSALNDTISLDAPLDMYCSVALREWRGLPDLRLTVKSLKFLHSFQPSLLTL